MTQVSKEEKKLECQACGKEQWSVSKHGRCVNCGSEETLEDIEWGEEEEEEEEDGA